MPFDRRSLLTEFWSKLDGPVHPADRPIFEAFPNHTFNLEFPPPVFVGDVFRAPILILMSNGGYKIGETESEFSSQEEVVEYLDYISGRSFEVPAQVSRYYRISPFWGWIEAGKAALINAVPYRSPRLSKEPRNQSLAAKLASLRINRQWLSQEVLPAARCGKRFVFVHRNRWWGAPPSSAGPSVIFSDPSRAEPNRPSPDHAKISLAADWLNRRTV
jgi:hypothetical protein